MRNIYLLFCVFSALANNPATFFHLYIQINTVKKKIEKMTDTEKSTDFCIVLKYGRKSSALIVLSKEEDILTNRRKESLPKNL